MVIENDNEQKTKFKDVSWQWMVLPKLFVLNVPFL